MYLQRGGVPLPRFVPTILGIEVNPVCSRILSRIVRFEGGRIFWRGSSTLLKLT